MVYAADGAAADADGTGGSSGSDAGKDGGGLSGRVDVTKHWHRSR
jgi:hypothetical protein